MSITVSYGADGKPKIDTSEIIRVFGELHVDGKTADNSLHNIAPDIAPVLLHKNNDMSGELGLMRELLAEKDKRIEDLQKALLMLADKTPKKRRWWFN